MNENDTVLNGRYTLTERVEMPGIDPSQLWEAIDRDGERHTLKITPYSGERPPSEVRRMWDNDLRVMYRLSSSAGANGQLVVMTDAGIDLEKSVMVLVYEGWQHVPFAEILADRERIDWLSFKRLKERFVRRDLWRALLQMAKGLKCLHDQNLIHRNVTPEAIWGQRDEGPESLRLSGFDWSARIGHASSTSEGSPWSTPPELRQVGYSFSSDWYGFGTIVARCFHRIEHLALTGSDGLPAALSLAISRDNPCNLEPLEKDLVKAITATDRHDRLQSGVQILGRIEKIIEVLDFGQAGKNDGRRVLLYLDSKNAHVIDAALRAGFTPNPDEPFEAFDSGSPEHSVRLKDFLADQWRTATLSWSHDGRKFELRCRDLFVAGERWMDYGDSKEQSWRAAKAMLRNTARLQESVPASGFDGVGIEVEFKSREVGLKIGTGSGFTSWDAFAPTQKNSKGLGPDSENLRQFFQVSNQFEILLRDAELFKYKVVHRQEENGSTKLMIVEVDEHRPSRSFFNSEKIRLIEFLQQERDSGNQYSDNVLLTETDSLFASKAGSYAEGAHFKPDDEQWTISEIDQDNETITIFRKNGLNAPPPTTGFLRTRGHHGQIRLIERRKQAIDRLSSHAFLLRTLAAPALTCIDSGPTALPWPQIEKGDVIDTNKLATIKDILRMRPMYALQGPPGTGKSTLVAHLLRQILEDDPMAQILVTAKDHAAVDVLLGKVMDEAYKGIPKEQRPLAIRLNRRDGKDHAKEQAQDLMRTALHAIGSCTDGADPHRDEIRRAWRTLLEKWTLDCQSEENQTLSNALVELVRRGASITSCTTSAGDLEALAAGTRSFDWSIVEEAGKTHGFDLALPLQAGHRWLLLGDHKQLRPFLHDEFAGCFNRLKGSAGAGDGVIDILSELGRKRGNERLIDIDWLKEKLEANEHWVKSFPSYARGWLASFSRVFEQQRDKLNGLTTDTIDGASAGLLTKQYRMPQAVGDLNSAVFYKDAVRKATPEEGNPDERHVNPFVSPSWLAPHSLIWVDMPWIEANKEAWKNGYSNRREQIAIRQILGQMGLAPRGQSDRDHTLAILTPYNWQKNNVNKDGTITAPAGCRFGSAQNREAGENKAKAYSVDSFQGDEADIVVVSLVRNKPMRAQDKPTPADIKFIAQPDRLNVMLSRARRLLVIVGSWDFLSACLAEVSSAADSEGNYNDPEYGPFKRTLEELEVMFADKRALKISMEQALQ